MQAKLQAKCFFCRQRPDRRVWALSFISCCFEGTNFLVIFYWSETLVEAHTLDNPDDMDRIPYGVIFATFMAAMVLGALLFNAVVRRRSARATPHISATSSTSSLLLCVSVSLAGMCLLGTAFGSHELTLLLSFLAFEFCNGVYVPSIASQRGLIVSDANRTSLYGLMKLPLFVFVIGSLWATAQGMSWVGASSEVSF